MPKKSTAHRDGWAWELLRDAAEKHATVILLRKFAKNLYNGALPKNLWSYLASVLMYPFHKKLPEERNPAKPTLRPMTVTSVLTRIGCRVMVKMKRVMVAEQLLLSHQFSFGINGGVQQVILACTITLEIKPTWLMLVMDSENAHTFCNRDKREEELEINVVFHYMIKPYKDLYGKIVTVQWHFKNGPDNQLKTFKCRARAGGMGMPPLRYI
jgi:hypothetical protein